MRKKIIILTVIIVVAIFSVMALIAFDVNPFQKKNQETKDNCFTKTIEVVAVEKGDLKNAISVKGTIDSENPIEINMPANAKIKEISVREGSRTRKGDILVVLDKDSLKDEYSKIYEEWVKAESDLGYMKPTYDYVRIIATAKGKVTENNLVKNSNTEDIIEEKEHLLVIENRNEKKALSNNVPNGKISSINYLSAKGREVKSGDLLFIVKVANGDFNTQVEKVIDLHEQLKVLQEIIEDPYIKTESNFIVSKINILEDGYYEKDTAFIKANPTDEILVKLAITKDELRKVSIDQEAKVTLDSGVQLAGSVSHISYSPNESGKFDLTVKLPDLEGSDVNDILPGLKAGVEIVLEEKMDVVKVPVDAIKTDSKGEYVLVYTGSIEDVKNYTVDTIPTEKRHIKKGLVTPLYVEIENGVLAGEKVVVVTVSKNENDFYGNIIGF